MTSQTHVSIQGDNFLLNGLITYPETAVEGLLLNSRMVQGIFDDRNPDTRPRWDYPDGPWSPDRNTDEFIAAMPTWRDHGLLAFTINLQGGSPEGYSKGQPWENTTFNPDGSLRSDHLARLARIVDRADQLSMVVILGLFYFGQDQRLSDEDAVRRGVRNAVDWLCERGDRHVMIEIANECDIIYHHELIKPPRVVELIHLARDTSNGTLLVSTSFSGGKVPTPEVIAASDFVLVHGNGVHQPDRLRQLIRDTRAVSTYRGQPVIVNEDDHFDFDQPDNNLLAAISEHASWGYFDYRMAGEGFKQGYQSVPADWGINSQRKRGFFDAVKTLSRDPK